MTVLAMTAAGLAAVIVIAFLSLILVDAYGFFEPCVSSEIAPCRDRDEAFAGFSLARRLVDGCEPRLTFQPA